MAAYDDLNTKRIFLVGIFSIFLVAVTALAAQVLYFSMMQWQHEETAAHSNYGRQNEILQEQSDEISTYGVNGENGNFVVPVGRVIDTMVAGAKDSSTSSDEATSDNPSNDDDHKTDES